MVSKMLLFQLSKENIERLYLIIEEINQKGIDGEIYVLNRIKKFELDLLYYENKSNNNDDGVDFIIKINNQIYIMQLKFYFKKSINKKEIKTIFGDMFLSDKSFEIRENYSAVKYIILFPFANATLVTNEKKYLNHNLLLIYGEHFIRFLVNPKVFLNNLM